MVAGGGARRRPDARVLLGRPGRGRPGCQCLGHPEQRAVGVSSDGADLHRSADGPADAGRDQCRVQLLPRPDQCGDLERRQRHAQRGVHGRQQPRVRGGHDSIPEPGLADIHPESGGAGRGRFALRRRHPHQPEQLLSLELQQGRQLRRRPHVRQDIGLGGLGSPPPHDRQRFQLQDLGRHCGPEPAAGVGGRPPAGHHGQRGHGPDHDGHVFRPQRRHCHPEGRLRPGRTPVGRRRRLDVDRAGGR